MVHPAASHFHVAGKNWRETMRLTRGNDLAGVDHPRGGQLTRGFELPTDLHTWNLSNKIAPQSVFCQIRFAIFCNNG